MQTITESSQKTERREESQVIDISANLLLTWVEDTKEQATKASSKSFRKIAGLIVAVGVIGGLSYYDLEEKSKLDVSRTQANKLKKQLKGMGLTSKQIKKASGGSEIYVIQELVKAYDTSNKDLVVLLGNALTKARGQMMLKDIKIESTSTGLKITGSSSVINVQTMRAYLDEIQNSVKGSEGLMTSINSATGPNEQGLNVNFEVARAASYNFTPAMQSQEGFGEPGEGGDAPEGGENSEAKGDQP